MDDLRKAAQMALEALEDMDSDDPELNQEWLGKKAITTLRAALAQPEQEPMVWTTLIELTWALRNPGRAGSFYAAKDGPADIPLYTHPPQRKPLTEEDIFRVAYAEFPYWSQDINSAFVTQLFRAFEKAHGIE